MPILHQPKSIAIVLGTRPELIKFAPLIALLGTRAHVVHTGQHFDDNLSGLFFRQFGIDAPAVNLGLGGRSRGTQIGEATSRLEDLFADDRPQVVVVHGDTNATVAGALASNACRIPLVHVEAGLRSFDRAMPEEHNRIITDHLADLCLAPTETNRANLAAEGIGGDRVILTGNTVVDAVLQLLPAAAERSTLLAHHGLETRRFIVATFHRPENTDDPGVLGDILRELAELQLPVLLPMHPRTRARIDRFGLGPLLERLRVIEPIGYSDFLGLAAESALLISDSGGVQEEASVIKRPVIVVRNSTERPEILGTFAQLVPPGPMIGEWVEMMCRDLEGLHARLSTQPSPYGDGTAAMRSLGAINTLLTRSRGA